MATDSNNTPSLRQEKADRSLIVTMAIVTMVVAVVAIIIGFCLMDKPEEFIEGQVEEHKHTHLRKASGACGRILC